MRRYECLGAEGPVGSKGSKTADPGELLERVYPARPQDLEVGPSPATHAISTQLKTGEISAKTVAADTYSTKALV